jgi:Ser/Thr protein kinase RdoA (MazF antagonist)
VRQELEQALGRPVAAVECRPHAYRTSFALDELDVRLKDGARLRLVRKHLGRTSLSDVAAEAKPAFLFDPLREIEIYRAIVTRHWIGSATFHGHLVDPEGDRYWLLLERVDGVELFQVGELSTWCEVARRLAAFHARCRDVRSTALLRYDAAYYRIWARRAQEFVGGRDVERAVHCHERAARRLLSLPPTVVHGELYASNVLVDARGERLRVCPVDWELAGIGPGLVDLAALTSGSWTERERRGIALAYYVASGGREPAFERFLESLECCRLHLALRWLGWSPGWSPPVEHRQDWLEEALRATACLAA